MKIGTKCSHKYHKIFSVFWNKYRNGNIAKLRLNYENVMYLEYMIMGHCIVLVFTELFIYIIVCPYFTDNISEKIK
jgi:hypothetical protein